MWDTSVACGRPVWGGEQNSTVISLCEWWIRSEAERVWAVSSVMFHHSTLYCMIFCITCRFIKSLPFSLRLKLKLCYSLQKSMSHFMPTWKINEYDLFVGIMDVIRAHLEIWLTHNPTAIYNYFTFLDFSDGCVHGTVLFLVIFTFSNILNSL